MGTLVTGHEELTKGIADYKMNYEDEMYRIKERVERVAAEASQIVKALKGEEFGKENDVAGLIMEMIEETKRLLVESEEWIQSYHSNNNKAYNALKNNYCEQVDEVYADACRIDNEACPPKLSPITPWVELDTDRRKTDKDHAVNIANDWLQELLA